jgi:hypothetical protein
MDTAPGQTQTTQAAPQGDLQNCRDFTAQVTVGGQPQYAAGVACQQLDGSWQVTLNTPGLPQQIYTLPPRAISLYPYSLNPYPEPYWDPLFYGPPFYVGGPVFLVHGFHRFQHHGVRHQGGFRHGGPRGGSRGGRK